MPSARCSYIELTPLIRVFIMYVAIAQMRRLRLEFCMTVLVLAEKNLRQLRQVAWL